MIKKEDRATGRMAYTAIKRKKNVFNTVYTNAEYSCTLHDITFEIFCEINDNTCNHCKSQIDSLVLKKKNKDLGFDADNLLCICKRCAIAKNGLSTSEYKEWIKRSYNTIVDNAVKKISK